MNPYSQDLRERIIGALEAEEDSQAETADTFGVSVSFIEKLWRRGRQSGSCAAWPPAGGRPRVLKDEEAWLRAAVTRQPDATVSEWCERVAQARGTKASSSMLCQHSNTRALLFNCFDLVEHWSTAFTLEPGGVISTGTPSGVGALMTPPQCLKAGEVVRITRDKLGESENPVIAEPDGTARIS